MIHGRWIDYQMAEVHNSNIMARGLHTMFWGSRGCCWSIWCPVYAGLNTLVTLVDGCIVSGCHQHCPSCEQHAPFCCVDMDEA